MPFFLILPDNALGKNEKNETALDKVLYVSKIEEFNFSFVQFHIAGNLHLPLVNKIIL